MIANFTNREDFAKVLHTHLSPTAPIESQEHLYGREHQLRQIEQALYAPGRSIFIYGDRGVGKTSLAQTIAHSHQSAKNEPVILACSPVTTFSGLMRDVIAALRGPQETPRTTTTSIKASVPKVPGSLEISRTHKPEPTESLDTLDLNGAVAMLLQISKTRGEESTVVVLDEFDRLASDVERTHFADFIKQIGDKHIPIRFVFCGVAESIQKLLGAHESCFRYLESVELQRLSWEGRFEIIDRAAAALGVKIEGPRTRIAAISDGFPHYVHLICEKLFWQMFNDEAPCTVPNADHYREAVAESVMGIEQHLRTTYEQAATQKEAHDYEDILWAVADHADLFRNTESIYASYSKLFGGLDLLDRQTMVSRLNALKSSSRGRILTNWNGRRGWYQFRESIMRGYVRLRAEEKGIELALDFAASTGSTTALAWPARGARRSRMTSRSDWDATKQPRSY